jgi:hypothetical protein
MGENKVADQTLMAITGQLSRKTLDATLEPNASPQNHPQSEGEEPKAVM